MVLYFWGASRTVKSFGRGVELVPLVGGLRLRGECIRAYALLDSEVPLAPEFGCVRTHASNVRMGVGKGIGALPRPRSP